ncbi:hypothetical protein O181_095580 [Austropuccinia psidii MF-1]|uniref:Reverse transcriptase Ty1/copia-type domain-containing protein n=1 Tax=Austropuccinia psidii MF-1 TaxID=1389203 RepID=A0A9Q3J5W4_9BASI|nr:hypothetical protein [Austropuccinia psidii MF-1]
MEEGTCLKLVKSLYGLKQSPRCWYKRLSEVFNTLVFGVNDADPCLFVKWEGTNPIMVFVHVDDMVIGGDSALVLKFKQDIQKYFKMEDLGEIVYVLGIKVTRNREDRTIYLSQELYVHKILDEFGMLNSQTALLNTERLLFLDCPSDDHVAAFKRILRYLQGTKGFSLVLGGNNPSSIISGFADSDWGSNYDGKSFSGFGVLFGGLITWKTKKQSTAALSTTEAELNGLVELAQDVLWLKKLLINLKIDPSVHLRCDNQGAVALCHNPLYHHKTRHLNIKLNWLRDLTINKEISLSYIPTSDMWADIFTKGLCKPKNQTFRQKLGLIALPSKRAY